MTVVINGTSGITDVNGTAAAPAITGTDTDTGVFFGTNTVSFSTGGTERLQVDSGGNLGLGVTPSAWNTAGLGRALQLVNSESRSSSLASWYGAVGLMNDAYYGTDNNFKYYSGAATALYQQAAGVHSWHYAASGTAGNTVTMTQAMTLDASGRLGIGTTSPSSQLHIENSSANATQLIKYTGTGGASQALFTLQNSAGNSLSIGTVSSTWSSGSGLTPGDSYVGASGNLLIGAGGTLPVAKFDTSGNFMVGVTSSVSSKVRISATSSGSGTPALTFAGASTNNACNIGCETGVLTNSYGTITIGTANPGNGYFISFSAPDGGYNYAIRGSIALSGTSTAYNTSSDYRLKKDIQPMTGALAKVLLLKPVTYKWLDDSDGEGFVAHELAEVVPQAVTGEKDAVEIVEVKDDDGNVTGTEERPVYQGIDTSFLVATLTAAIQEQQALIAQLQADVAALKGNA